eukprot:jgi/Hompol1/3887/HPOL_003383-RA
MLPLVSKAASFALRRAPAVCAARALPAASTIYAPTASTAARIAAVRYASSHGNQGDHQHTKSDKESESEKEGGSSAWTHALLIASLLALGPGYQFLVPKSTTTTSSTTSTSSPKADDASANSPASTPQKVQLPSRAAGRADKPKPIKGVPYVPYVLVGGGTASYSAMEAIREAQPDAQILIISEEDFVPYQRPPLSKELWFSEPNKELVYADWEGNKHSTFYLPKESFVVHSADKLSAITEQSTKVHYLPNTKVTKLSPEDQTITLANGSRIQYARVLIATGASPKTLPVFDKAPEEVKPRIFSYRGIRDYWRLRDVANGPKTVAIVGGGFLGSELSIALAKQAKDGVKVVQVFPEDGNLSAVFPHYLTKWTTSKLRKAGVDVKPNFEISSVDLNDSKVTLKSRDGSVVEADYVVVAVGVSPNDELARASDLEIDLVRKGIIVNAELEARTNVFAAGDVTSYHDIALGRRRVEHYDHAVMSGRMAGFNMTGAKRPYTHQFGTCVIYYYYCLQLLNPHSWLVADHCCCSADAQLASLRTNLKMDVARKIIRDGKSHPEIDSLARQFAIHE